MLQLLQFKFYSLLWRVPPAGGNFKGEKSPDNGAIILRLTFGISDFCQFLPASGRTTTYKQGINTCISTHILWYAAIMLENKIFTLYQCVRPFYIQDIPRNTTKVKRIINKGFANGNKNGNVNRFASNNGNNNGNKNSGNVNGNKNGNGNSYA